MGLRLSNFELLRFLSMLLVLALHCNFLACGGVGFRELCDNPWANGSRIFLESISLVCVNVFVLISGWFGIHRKKSGFINIIVLTIFVTLICLLISLLMGWFSISGIRDFSGYWFLIAYIGLYILSPILNVYLATCSKRDLIITLCSYALLSFFCGWIYDVASFHRGFSFVHFIGLYLLGGFLKYYSNDYFSGKGMYYWIFLFLLFSCLNSLFYCVGLYFSSEFIFDHWAQYINPLVVAASVCLFMSFASISIKQNPVINYLGSIAFPIYLFHTNGFIWKHFLDIAHSIFLYNSGFACVFFMILYIIAITIFSLLINLGYRYANSFLH